MKTVLMFLGYVGCTLVFIPLLFIVSNFVISEVRTYGRLKRYFEGIFQEEIALINKQHLVDGFVQNLGFVFFDRFELSKDSPVKACVVDRKIDWDCVGARPDTSAIVTASEFNWR